ncbi:MAG: serine/threonine protein kinase [Bradymonadaceae bacterium]|nr:serine/threonine protein kinase [Lujinxingiaceae bacterium]
MAQPRYQVIERIDAGGMAEVFKANSTSLQGFQKLVAIKRILPNLTQNQRFVRMFLDEAKVSLHLNHTNTVHVFDLGIADGTYFIVMEFVDGTNLKNIVEHLNQQQRALPVEQAVFVAIEVCKGLTHAHDKLDQAGRHLGIVHRDISPPNVLISRSGEVKITDFGLAKAKSQVEITDPGVVKGKFGYLSPEAALGEEVDERTDIFAVGILLWEMLAGRRLFLGETDFETLQQVRSATVPSLSTLRKDVPPELERVLAMALERDSAKRFQTSKSFAQALAKFMYSYGRVVTSYDIAHHVLEYMDKRGNRERTERDAAVDAAVQQELNRIVSLEQIGDLDTYLAENYDSMTDEGGDGLDSDGNFEDPRMWAELGFGAEEAAGDHHAAEQGLSEEKSVGAWQEGGLEDLMRPTTPLPAAPPTPPRSIEHTEDATVELRGMRHALPKNGAEVATAPMPSPRAKPAPSERPSPPAINSELMAGSSPESIVETTDMEMPVAVHARKTHSTPVIGAAKASAGSNSLALILGGGVVVCLLVAVLLYLLVTRL